MARLRRKKPVHASVLFRFDTPYWQTYGLVAGVDEVGRGPLAGPVVAAAVILRKCKIPYLADSKLLTPERREAVFRVIQQEALAIGIGIIPHDEIDRINIYHASFAAMRLALSQLIIQPKHVLVDGFKIPKGPDSQTGVIGGDRKSACIAAASIVAKVTRDNMMVALDREYPVYGFKQHKGYGTPNHLKALVAHGPCAIHRRSFQPVALAQ